MIVIDTNVLSELIHPNGDARVVAWVDQRPADQFHLTAVTTAELRYGIARLPEGRRRTALGERAEQVIGGDFAGRVLPFDDNAAVAYAAVVAAREVLGRPISMADAQIAAICRAVGADLATRNVKDFAFLDIRVLNPWTVDTGA